MDTDVLEEGTDSIFRVEVNQGENLQPHLDTDVRFGAFTEF